MKTLKNISIKNSLAVSLVASVLFLASCEKDNVLPQSQSATAVGVAVDRQAAPLQSSEASAAVLAAKGTVEMIKIDHISARSLLPDYSVTVKFDGSVVFQGRRNVAFIGSKEWKLRPDQFFAIEQLFEHSGFNGIEDHLSLLADVPMVATSWSARSGLAARTLIDYNDGYPEGLISLRQKAETMLDLSKLIRSDVLVVKTSNVGSL